MLILAWFEVSTIDYVANIKHKNIRASTEAQK